MVFYFCFFIFCGFFKSFVSFSVVIIVVYIPNNFVQELIFLHILINISYL